MEIRFIYTNAKLINIALMFTITILKATRCDYLNVVKHCLFFLNFLSMKDTKYIAYFYDNCPVYVCIYLHILTLEKGYAGYTFSYASGKLAPWYLNCIRAYLSAFYGARLHWSFSNNMNLTRCDCTC